MYKVIIADDEYMIHASLAKQVESSGLPYQVVGEAEDGQEALLLLSEQPDLIVTDICMPAMDGLTFIEQARAANPHVVFLIISGYSDFEYARTALQLGVEDYLVKPVSPDKFRAALESILHKIESRKHQLLHQKQWVVHQLELLKELESSIWRLDEKAARQAAVHLLEQRLPQDAPAGPPSLIIDQIKSDLSEMLKTRGIDVSYLLSNKGAAIQLDSSEPEAAFLQYVSLLLDQIKQERNFGSRNQILRAIAHTRKHLHASDLSVQQAADMAGMSTTYFSRLFKEETGVSYVQYVIKLRMEEARILLEQQACSASEACERTGYTDYPHFSKTFKRYYGIAPADYMKHHRSL